MSNEAGVQSVTLSPAQLRELIEAAVAAGKKPSPLEQRDIDAEVERDKRRTLMQVELAKVEEEKALRRKNGCSHSRHERTGLPVAKGTGQWTTSGQFIDRERFCLICVRCSYRWIFKPTPAEIEYLTNAGPGGYTPPTANIVEEG